MACPPLVPISIIPPVSQGVAPILWQNGSQITRLNTPLNPSFLVYNGSATTWADGSSQNPVYLPNIQQAPTTSINYLVGTIANGSIAKAPLGTNGQFLGSNGTGLVWQNSSTGTANNIAGGAAGDIVYQTGVSTTGFTAAGTTGQVLTSNGTSAPTWVSQSSLSVGNAVNANNATTATNAVNATTATNVSGGTVSATTGTFSGQINSTNLVASSNSSTGTTLQLMNTDTGGHSWIIVSNGSGNLGGSGALQIYDATANATRIEIFPNGSISTYSNPITNCKTTAKAWVNFNGTFGYVTGQSYSRTGTTVTVTTTNHFLTNGQLVQIASATDTALNGQNYPITVVNANQFSFQTTSTGTATGTLSWTGVIRSGYNISSITKNATGDYTVNYATAFSNANYSVVVSTSNISAGSPAYMCVPYTISQSTTQTRHQLIEAAQGATFGDASILCVQIFGN